MSLKQKKMNYDLGSADIMKVKNIGLVDNGKIAFSVIAKEWPRSLLFIYLLYILLFRS